MQVDEVLKEPLAQPWMPTDEEASMMRDMVSKEKAWQKNLQCKEQWLFGLGGTSGAHSTWSASEFMIACTAAKWARRWKLGCVIRLSVVW